MIRLGLNASVLVCVGDARHIFFANSMMGVIQPSFSNGLIYFNCLPNFIIGLHRPNALKAATMNVMMEEDSEPYALIYLIQYKVMKICAPNARVLGNK